MATRLLRHPLGRWVDPPVAFEALFAGATDVAWLDSGTEARAGRSYMGVGSTAITSETGSVLTRLKSELATNSVSGDHEGFALGWVGWIGYETRFETMDAPRTRESPFPDSAFLYLDRALEFDHSTGQVSLLALGDEWAGELADWRDESINSLNSAAGFERQTGRRTSRVERPTATPTWRDTDDEYLALIRSCQESIAAGDAYLLCLTTQAIVNVTPDPFETYLALRESSPSHHGALVRIGDVALLSASPEQFLSVSPDGRVESRPIKGTRARGTTAEEDLALANELETSEKERAENLMIVDLMRNDISRVSRIGSVEVTSLLAVESYAHVHQLVSTVRGQLEQGVSGVDAVIACFPAGSMTGAPKSSAVRILDALEGHPRGIYSGVFGYFGLDGRIDLAMVIRSIILSPSGATVGAGGGITILSDPVEELAEVKLKADALLWALGVS